MYTHHVVLHAPWLDSAFSFVTKSTHFVIFPFSNIYGHNFKVMWPKSKYIAILFLLFEIKRVFLFLFYNANRFQYFILAKPIFRFTRFGSYYLDDIGLRFPGLPPLNGHRLPGSFNLKSAVKMNWRFSNIIFLWSVWKIDNKCHRNVNQLNGTFATFLSAESQSFSTPSIFARALLTSSGQNV